MTSIPENLAVSPTEQIDIGRAAQLTPEVVAAIDDMFTYHPWNDAQKAAGEEIRKILAAAAKRIVAIVPRGPDRTVALRKLRECRMDCNSAITHGGKY